MTGGKRQAKSDDFVMIKPHDRLVRSKKLRTVNYLVRRNWTLSLVILLGVASCAAPTEGRWLLTATKVYVDPDSSPVDNGWVLIRDGKIESVGDADARPPEGQPTTGACNGGVVTAGFQNSHVHFIDRAFAQAASRPAAGIEQSLTRMLSSFGMTTVVDTGSFDLANTIGLRQRIEREEIKGPRILTAGAPLFPRDGIPFYLRDMPPEVLGQLAQPSTAEEGSAVVARNFAEGATGTKLFVATPQSDGSVKRMSPDIARSAAEETHKRGGLVMAHPPDPEGVRAAVTAGVDIVVHTTIHRLNVWSTELIRDMVARRVSLVPTLKLWRYELAKSKAPKSVEDQLVADARIQLKAFADAGGQVLFGTDVGYMSDFDPREEYVEMSRAGLTPMQILASLTTAPAARWNEEKRRGRVKPGFDADLVVLDGDPAADVKHFTDVKCTIRSGTEVFRNE